MAFGRAAGFALVETVVALGLLSLGAVGLVTGFASGLRAQEGALLQRTVVLAVADVGELLRASPAALRVGQAQAWSSSLLAPRAPGDAAGWQPRSLLRASAVPAVTAWQAEVTWRDGLGADERRLRVALALPP